ncbi:MAG: hypothetical protein NVSMB64_25230 [Candidatus Velthaea sp.]
MNLVNSRQETGGTITLEFKCFGSFSIQSDARGLRKGPTRARGGDLLGYLASYPHAAVSREELCEVLWPGHLDQSAHRLHLAASRARSAIRDDCGSINPIVYADGTYAWNSAIRVVRDADYFEQCWAQRSADAFARATALYDGPYMAGESADWIQPLRVRYEHLFVTMLERLAVDAYQTGDFADATSFALRLIAVDRAHERATQLAMACLAKSGRRAQAVREYESLKRYLHAWIGVAPTSETEIVLANIIAGNLDLLVV